MTNMMHTSTASPFSQLYFSSLLLFNNSNTSSPNTLYDIDFYHDDIIDDLYNISKRASLDTTRGFLRVIRQNLFDQNNSTYRRRQLCSDLHIDVLHRVQGPLFMGPRWVIKIQFYGKGVTSITIHRTQPDHSNDSVHVTTRHHNVNTIYDNMIQVEGMLNEIMRLIEQRPRSHKSKIRVEEKRQQDDHDHIETNGKTECNNDTDGANGTIVIKIKFKSAAGEVFKYSCEQRHNK